MPRLPDFNPITNVNASPHVIILGAGASKAAFPRGDATGKRVPLMTELPDCLGLRSLLGSAGFPDDADFESVYDELSTAGKCPSLVEQMNIRLRCYFESLVLPESPTLYDYLLLSLREKDLIATFNWDPFLAKAYKRNREVQKLPQIAFLHGNVEAAVCLLDRVKGFRGESCQKCGKEFQPTKLLYPTRNKNYKSDPFIVNEWDLLRDFLKRAYMLTIFGYGAPSADAAAVHLMSGFWGKNPTFELAQVNIVDIKPEEDLEKTWLPFLCRNHYAVHGQLSGAWILRYPRRSCEALAMATLQNDPWRDNLLPEFETLAKLHAWVAPLIGEEHHGWFSGQPCPPTPM